MFTCASQHLIHSELATVLQWIRPDGYSKDMTAVTRAILDQIRLLGYSVKVSQVDGRVEIRAAKGSGPDELFVARHEIGGGDEETYVIACRIAEMVGIDLSGG
jgi:hypothetical protein